MATISHNRFVSRTYMIVASWWFLILLAFYLFIPVQVSHCGVGDWETYTNTNFVNQVQIVDGAVWSATSGGVLELTMGSGVINKYTNVDGLGWIDVLSLSVDRLGKLWFGTDGGGVSTFYPAGGRWTTYTEFDGVAGKVVGAILATQERIWVGTEKGVSLFEWNEEDGEYFWKENYLAERRVPVRQVRDFLDWDSEIWIATEEGVARARYRHPDYVPNLQDSTSWINYTTSDGLLDNEVNCLVLADTTIWAGTSLGVNIFNNGTWISHMPGMPPNTEVYDLAFREDTVWAGTSRGLYIYQGQWTQKLGGERVTSVDIDSEGFPWLGTENNGIWTAQGEQWIRYITEGPAENNIERVLVDRQKFLWVTTIAPGYFPTAARLAEGTWTIFDSSDGLRTGDRLLGLLEDHQGRKWFGSWGEGVSVLDDKGTLAKEDDVWMYFDQDNSALKGIIKDPIYVVVTDIEQDRQGNFWFLNYLGVESGLVVCDSALIQWTSYSTRDGLVYPEVQALAIDPNGNKWIGATQEGMSRFDDAGTPFNKEDDDPDFAWLTYSEDSTDPSRVIVSDNVTSVCVDGEGNVWIGTAAGIMRFTNFYFSSVDGLINESVHIIVPDARDNIWVGTDGGLSFYDIEREEWTHFTAENSDLVSNRIQDIAIDQDYGVVWIATDRGLSRYESGIIPPITTMESIHVFPSPFLPERDELLTFMGLADGSIISIFTLTGELIREISMPRYHLNQAHWDGRNDHGALVASGVYLYLATTEDGLSAVGKIALIR